MSGYPEYVCEHGLGGCHECDALHARKCLEVAESALTTARAQLAVLAAEVIRHRKDRKEQGVPGMSIETMATNADPALAAMIEGGG